MEQIGYKAPLRPSPRFASFKTVDGTTDYFVFVNCKPLCKVAIFARAIMLWFVSHYIFHLEYAKEIKEIGYFFQETVFGSIAKAKKTATYLSVTTAIQSHAE